MKPHFEIILGAKVIIGLYEEPRTLQRLSRRTVMRAISQAGVDDFAALQEHAFNR